MIEKIIFLLFNVRGFFVRTLFPFKGYFVLTRSLKPLSKRGGFDRGTPIDRYYIEKFVNQNKKYIKGVCLEIGDRRYTTEFGEGKVTKIDVLDRSKKNPLANIYADLTDLNVIPSDTYDCIIFTHVLGMIYDYEKVLSGLRRILKKDGVLLFAGSYFAKTMDARSSYWRFTVHGCRKVFGKYFNRKNLYVKSYGNVLVGQYFWVGASCEDITKSELEYNDPNFPCTIVARAKK